MLVLTSVVSFLVKLGVFVSIKDVHSRPDHHCLGDIHMMCLMVYVLTYLSMIYVKPGVSEDIITMRMISW